MGQSADNKRAFFRVPFEDHPGTMHIIAVGGRPIKTDPKPIQIHDISGGGLCVACQEDISIRRGIVALFEFTIGGEFFAFMGTLVRKVDDMKTYEYGVRFVDVDQRRQGDLISVLGRLQVEKRAKVSFGD